MRRYRGGCFCGAIKVTFETRHAPARTRARRLARWTPATVRF